MSHVHVLVVGAGPAGASLAILCRSFGLNVCLLEASPERAAPGEALPQTCEEYFRKLGVSDRLITPERIRYQGMDYRWGDYRQENVDWEHEGDTHRLGFRLGGIQIPRDTLDRTLLERAEELGVMVLQPCVAKSLMTLKGRICGVVTSLGPVAADFIVDAAGSRHWIARKLRMNMQYFSPEMYGYYGWAEGRCPERERRPLITSDETGWQFTSRIADDLYQFSRMSFSPLKLSSDWLPEEFAKNGMRSVLPLTNGAARPSGKLRGADLTWRRVFQATGPGFFLCGDAVARTDPIGQQGVFRSMVAGFQCALALNAIYHGGVPEEEARRDYSEWIATTYLRDLTAARESYQRHPNAPAWLRTPDSIFAQFAEPEVETVSPQGAVEGGETPRAVAYQGGASV